MTVIQNDPVLPPNGSDRGKRAYILLALVEYRPLLTRHEVRHLLGWDNEEIDQAIEDAATLERGAASAVAV